MTRSIPIKYLEKLASNWEGWAAERIREYKKSPTSFKEQLKDTASGCMDCALELRRLMREIATGEEPEQMKAPVGRDPQADTLAPKHAHPATIKPVRHLFAVCDPTGHIDHTTLSTRDDEAIAAWLKTEQTLIPIFRGKPAQSWEVYEAEGYQIVGVEVVLSSPNK